MTKKRIKTLLHHNNGFVPSRNLSPLFLHGVLSLLLALSLHTITKTDAFNNDINTAISSRRIPSPGLASSSTTTRNKQRETKGGRRILLRMAGTTTPEGDDNNDAAERVSSFFSSAKEMMDIAMGPPTALSITQLTDKILEAEGKKHSSNNEDSSSFSPERTTASGNGKSDFLPLFVLRWIRSAKLDELLRTDREAYIATATFLSSSIPRSELPNVQDVPHPESGILRRSREERKRREERQLLLLEEEEKETAATTTAAKDSYGRDLVPDCTIPDAEMGENLLEAALLHVTRNIYADITGTERRKDIEGIPGLVEEMRTYMLSPKGSSPQLQQKNLLATLLVLMTPVLPPFYRIFMGWKVPSRAAGDPEWLVDFVNERLNPVIPALEEGRNFGPAPYAPLLTSWVAPFVFSFLVGPVRINLRSDGQWGGIIVEKCKFLQESNCKGMCLHSCKAPAQELFEDVLGLPLRVSPNFDSQECQWNFGESAPPPQDDPTWPKGCLVGCTTREAVADIARQQQQQQEEEENKDGSTGSTTKTTEIASCY